MSGDPLILGVALSGHGHHPGAWRRSRAAKSEALDGLHFARLAQAAEAGKLDFVSLGYPMRGSALAPPSNAAVELDPLSLAASLIHHTRHVGLCSPTSAAYWEPFNVARAFSTLDNLSRGRAGWHCDTQLRNGDFENYSHRFENAALPSYARAREFLGVTRALWDSWAEDALVFDRDAAVFTDRKKVHRINHAGAHFTVEGPLNAPRPPQGHVPIIQSDLSAEGLMLAAETADVVIARPASIADAIALRMQMNAQNSGRRIKLLVDVLTVLAPTDAEAHERLSDLEEVSPTIGHELTFVGKAEALADLMLEWHLSGACDGFHVLPAAFPDDLRMLVEDGVPRLQKRGAFRTDYTSHSLRENLRLAPAPNRFDRLQHGLALT